MGIAVCRLNGGYVKMGKMKKAKATKSNKAKKTSKPRKKAAQAMPPEWDEERKRKFKELGENLKEVVLKNLRNRNRPPTP